MSHTYKCHTCTNRVLNGQPCPVCNPDPPEQETPFPVSQILPEEEPKKSVNIATTIGFVMFLVFLGFFIFYLLEVLFGGGSIPSVFTTPSATLLPLPEEDMPDIIIHPVGECRVEGEVDTVTPYKVEIRQMGETLLTQFQTDDGKFVTSLLPSFGGRKFLLVCIDKEVGPAWAETYGEGFFEAIGTRPINDVTGKEDASTTSEGYWLFPNPEKFRPQNPTPTPGAPAPADSAPAPESTQQQTSENDDKSSATSTPPPQTPYPTFTPTPETVEEARAVEQGESDDGPQELAPVNMSNLTSRSAPIWSKPGIDSVEIRKYESGVNTSWIAWAPSFAAAEWYMWVWETQTLGSQATQAGCSSFILEGALIYEQKVNNQLTFVRNDSAGVAKYMFPADQTSVFGCYVWPTSTPAPTSTPRPTQPPAAPTYTPIPTATPQQPSGCHVTISWNSLISNPGQVTGSGNSYLTKWNQVDNTYVGDATEQAIFYCITNRPATINGVAWNQQLISLTGQQYGGSGECQVSGTNIWVANCWK